LIHERWDPATVLPWTHLRGPLEPGLLQRHRQEALAGAAAATGE
jgi:hypothetical protein